MKTYTQTLRYMYGLQRRGMKFGLRNVRALLKSAGNPERAFSSVHVAGTNGKGSTASFLASIMMESGYRTGLYTSPHLEQFTERIRIDGQMIPERRLVEYVRELRPYIEAVHATFFEATTCVAFRYFADEGVDLAVIETGLGGRLDATNVLTPMVSVIASIGYDHMEYLGNTIRSIAREKGGIIKAGVPAVTSSNDRVALRTLRAIAGRRHSRLYHSECAVTHRPGRRSGNGKVLRLRSRLFDVRNVRLGLTGPHQQHNARLAIAALDVMLRNPAVRKRFLRVTADSIRRGLRWVRENVGLNGRLQVVGTGQRFLLDVAHNPDGVRVLASAVEQMPRRARIAVLGAMKDKDSGRMIRALSPVVDQIVVVAARTPRALPSRLLFRVAAKAGIPAIDGGTVRHGVALAQELAGGRGQVLITGSHYVVGEALGLLKKKRYS